MATKRTVNQKNQGTKQAAEAASFTAEILARAKKIGIPPEAVVEQDRERDEERLIRDRVGPYLLRACDQLGEELATYEEPANSGDSTNVRAALHTLWKLRWDLGMFSDKEPRDDDDQAEQAAEGGAA